MSIEGISKKVGDYVAVIVLLIGALALYVPQTFTWIPSTSLTWLLGIVMFCMGLTLRLEDFKIVVLHPLPVLAGCVAQFTIMPALAWVLCHLFSLPIEVAVGVVLVGCCPGGTASNIITLLAKGDIALSVCMTGFSTILAPVLTPFLTWLVIGKSVDVDVYSMIFSVLQIVIFPIILGFIIKYIWGNFAERMLHVLPLCSTFAIAVIIGVVLSANAARVLGSGWIIFSVVVLHNFAGILLGYGVGKAMKLPRPQRSALCIEVGMQNSALATSLAATHFAMYPLATIPGAIFSVWHNFSGAIAASILRKMK